MNLCTHTIKRPSQFFFCLTVNKNLENRHRFPYTLHANTWPFPCGEFTIASTLNFNNCSHIKSQYKLYTLKMYSLKNIVDFHTITYCSQQKHPRIRRHILTLNFSSCIILTGWALNWWNTFLYFRQIDEAKWTYNKKW